MYTGSLLERDVGTSALAIKQKEGFLVNKLQTKQNTALLSKKGYLRNVICGQKPCSDQFPRSLRRHLRTRVRSLAKTL